jgi:hypothetical protein
MSNNNIDGIFVLIDVTHGGYVNRNSSLYSDKALMNGAKSWAFPYSKPLILHHNWESDPIGRVAQVPNVVKYENLTPDKFHMLEAATEYDPDNLPTSKLQVVFHVNDSKAVEKIKDGRYLTTSIGGTAKKVTCSICEQNIAVDGPCEHYKGETYDGELCYWNIESLDYQENSVVVVPADQTDIHAAKIVGWIPADRYNNFLREMDQRNINPEHIDLAYIIENDITVDQFISDLVNNDTKEVKDMGVVNKKKKTNQPTPDELKKKVKDGDEKTIVEVSDELHIQQSDTEATEKGLSAKTVKNRFDGRNSKTDGQEFFEKVVIVWEVSARDFIEMSDAKRENYITNEKLGHKHRSIIDPETGNGYTDYVLGHSHDVVNKELQSSYIVYDYLSDKVDEADSYPVILESHIHILDKKVEPLKDFINKFVIGIADFDDEIMTVDDEHYEAMWSYWERLQTAEDALDIELFGDAYNSIERGLAEITIDAKFKSAERKKIKKSDFCKPAECKYPVPNVDHVNVAMAYAKKNNEPSYVIAGIKRIAKALDCAFSNVVSGDVLTTENIDDREIRNSAMYATLIKSLTDSYIDNIALLRFVLKKPEFSANFSAGLDWIRTKYVGRVTDSLVDTIDDLREELELQQDVKVISSTELKTEKTEDIDKDSKEDTKLIDISSENARKTIAAKPEKGLALLNILNKNE